MPQGATATRVLQVGDTAPDFTLASHLDTEVALHQFRGRRHVFLAFYPLDWTPV